MASPGGAARGSSPDLSFPKLRSFSSMMRDISLSGPEQGLETSAGDSSLGLLPGQQDASTMDLLTKSALHSSFAQGTVDVSLGRYLQPSNHQLRSDGESEASIRPSSSALADLDRLYAQFTSSDSEDQELSLRDRRTGALALELSLRDRQTGVQGLEPQTGRQSECEEVREEREASFSWEKLLGEAASQTRDSHLPAESFYQDPSFCSGKISARSTSFGGAGVGGGVGGLHTRDENFSDFSKPASFQSSYVSNFSEAMGENRSVFHSGTTATLVKQQLKLLNPWEQEDPYEGGKASLGLGGEQQQFGLDFSDQEFGAQGDVMDFLDQEEQDCLKENPFIEEEACETSVGAGGAGGVNSSAFSGVSDKSIVLRNSNLWGGDTTNVDLEQLRREEEGLKVSRCEYFRHNSSRLGSLDESLPEGARPEFGFVHHIRSPERKPCRLLSETQQLEPAQLSSTFSLELPAAPGSQDPSPASSPGSSGPSSSNTTYMPSGESTKTVVSLGDYSGTINAADLASRLETIASQLLVTDTPQRKRESVRADPELLEASLQSCRSAIGDQLDLSTISKVLSEASISSDPQHFVSAILGCLRKSEERTVAPAASTSEWTVEGASAVGGDEPRNAVKSQQAVKPIQPFGGAAVRPVVLPMKAQALSEPSSREATPALLHKTASLPSSLDSSSRRKRRPSGARHSSPIKSAPPGTPTPSASLTTTPHAGDLSRILAAACSPGLRIAASSHLATSTPFHADMNLSSVILDHLTHNQSVSPLVVPDTSHLLPPTLDLSTIDPGLLVNSGLQQELSLSCAAASAVRLSPDWTLESVHCSHTPLSLAVPLHHTITSPVALVARVTDLLVGAHRLPDSQWPEVVQLGLGREWGVTLQPGDRELHLPLTPLTPGIITLGLGILTGRGVSSGQVRIRVEDANIQVLTEDGVRINFGSLAEECSAEQELVLVNCGQAAVPVHLEITSPETGIFSLEGGSRKLDFVVPGVTIESATPGQGVARRTLVRASTAGVTAGQEVTVCSARLEVGLGQGGGTPLGALQMCLRLGKARLRTKKTAEPLVLRCGGDQSVSRVVELANSGNMPLRLEVEVAETSEGVFTLPRQITVQPETTAELTVTFTAAAATSVASSVVSCVSHSLQLSVVPGGPVHLVGLETQVAASATFRPPNKPTLSFGVLKKPQEEKAEEQEFSRFPVECDRSQVNFLCVAPGGQEEQSLALRNSTREPVSLTAILRECERFSLRGPAGLVASLQVTLQPGHTQELRLVYSPLEKGEVRGKLVLKPQGRRVGGKAFKASIGLCGLAGRFEVEVHGAERTASAAYRLVCAHFPDTRTLQFVNRGDFAAFVKVVPDCGPCGGDPRARLEVSLPGEMVVPQGEVREVEVTALAGGGGGLAVFLGPEVARQVMRRARKLPGAVRLSDDPALLGENMAAVVAGEECLGELEEWRGRPVTCQDVRHFYQLTAKSLVRVTAPASPQEFGQLTVEETLSETRLEQSVLVSHSPPTREEGGLSITPRLLSLVRGGEALVRLGNRGAGAVSWELAWPPSVLAVQPSAGSLAPGGLAVVCVTALQGRGQWRGNVQLYCDNSVDSIEVCVSDPRPLSLVATPTTVELGLAVLGSTTTRSLAVSNPGDRLVQWQAQVEPSFFSLPLSSGLLNPGQEVVLAVHYRPASPGQHSAALALTSAPLQGGDSPSPHLQRGSEAYAGGEGGVTVRLRGEAVALTQAVATGTRPGPASAKKVGGGLSLESHLISFPNTRVGDTTVSKMKIKNRSPNDHTVEILAPAQTGPFRIAQTVVEVKTGCYLSVPIQFRPLRLGEARDDVVLRWGGSNSLSASLRGLAI